jgi:hypothetical protein
VYANAAVDDKLRLVKPPAVTTQTAVAEAAVTAAAAVAAATENVAVNDNLNVNVTTTTPMKATPPPTPLKMTTKATAKMPTPLKTTPTPPPLEMPTPLKTTTTTKTTKLVVALPTSSRTERARLHQRTRGSVARNAIDCGALYESPAVRSKTSPAVRSATTAAATSAACDMAAVSASYETTIRATAVVPFIIATRSMTRKQTFGASNIVFVASIVFAATVFFAALFAVNDVFCRTLDCNVAMMPRGDSDARSASVSCLVVLVENAVSALVAQRSTVTRVLAGTLTARLSDQNHIVGGIVTTVVSNKGTQATSM